jgi:hypothetical protein
MTRITVRLLVDGTVHAWGETLVEDLLDTPQGARVTATSIIDRGEFGVSRLDIEAVVQLPGATAAADPWAAPLIAHGEDPALTQARATRDHMRRWIAGEDTHRGEAGDGT